MQNNAECRLVQNGAWFKTQVYIQNVGYVLTCGNRIAQKDALEFA